MRLFRRKPPESRSYESVTLAQAIDAAEVGTTARTAVVEFCASTWGNGLAAAEVSGAMAGTVTREYLHRCGRALVEHGECLAVVDTRGEVPRLFIPSSYAVHAASAHPDTWRYQVHDGSQVAHLEHGQVVHLRINMSQARPWAGRSPVELARQTVAAMVGLQVSTGGELSLPSLRIVNSTTGAPAAMARLAGQLNEAKGRGRIAVLPEGYGNEQHRIGGDVPQSHAGLWSVLSQEVCSACGVPPALMDSSAPAASLRESWRRFLFGSLAPTARLLESELQAKLAPDMRLDFAELRASDLTGRARAMRSLVESGIELTEAREICGL